MAPFAATQTLHARPGNTVVNPSKRVSWGSSSSGLEINVLPTSLQAGRTLSKPYGCRYTRPPVSPIMDHAARRDTDKALPGRSPASG